MYVPTLLICFRYGLILPDKVKNQPVFKASSNVFGNEDDSEDEVEKKQFLNSNTRRKVNTYFKYAVCSF